MPKNSTKVLWKLCYIPIEITDINIIICEDIFKSLQLVILNITIIIKKKIITNNFAFGHQK